MNNLHPVMRQALAPFAPKPMIGIQRPPMPKAPSCPDGFVEFHWCSDCEIPIVCHLEIHRGQAEDRTDPSYMPHLELHAAYIRDVDIYYLLDLKQISSIEQLALESHMR